MMNKDYTKRILAISYPRIEGDTAGNMIVETAPIRNAITDIILRPTKSNNKPKHRMNGTDTTPE